MITFASDIRDCAPTKTKYVFLHPSGKYIAMAKKGKTLSARAWFAETAEEVKEALGFIRKHGTWPDGTV